jgi:hypothetical protein
VSLIPATTVLKKITSFPGVADTGNACLTGVVDTGKASIAGVVDTAEAPLKPLVVRQCL